MPRDLQQHDETTGPYQTTSRNDLHFYLNGALHSSEKNTVTTSDVEQEVGTQAKRDKQKGRQD